MSKPSKFKNTLHPYMSVDESHEASGIIVPNNLEEVPLTSQFNSSKEKTRDVNSGEENGFLKASIFKKGMERKAIETNQETAENEDEENQNVSQIINQQKTMTEVRMFEAGYELQKTWHIVTRVIILVFEFIVYGGALGLLIWQKVLDYYDKEYHYVSTYVTERDYSIKYMVANKTVLKFFMYDKAAVNTTDGLTVTSEYHSMDIDMNAICEDGYEFYTSQSTVEELANYLESYYMQFLFCLTALLIVSSLVSKCLLFKLIFGAEIPRPLKYKMKSKWVLELTIQTFVSFMILSFFGSLAPLTTVDTQSTCLVSTISMSVKTIYDYFYACGILLFFFLIPLLLFLMYSWMEDIIRYAFFGLFYMCLPALVIYIIICHAFIIRTLVKSEEFYILIIYGVNYISFFLMLILTMTFSILSNNRFESQSQRNASEELRILPTQTMVKKAKSDSPYEE